MKSIIKPKSQHVQEEAQMGGPGGAAGSGGADDTAGASSAFSAAGASSAISASSASEGDFDDGILQDARNHLRSFVERSAAEMPKSGRMLDIGPQGRTFVKDSFPAWRVETLDLVDDFDPDYVGDITCTNEAIPDGFFDAVACLEVLEHTVNPFDAVAELRRILAPGGVLLVSAPLNFRIHGPLPDCWRFTEYGWRVLLKDFEILEMDAMACLERPLFPVKYNIRARVDHEKCVDPRAMRFERIKTE